MNNQNITEFIAYAKISCMSAVLGKKNADIISKVIEATPFLPIGSNIRYRLYCIEYNLTAEQLCPTCGVETLKWRADVHKLRTYCSSKCTVSSTQRKDKTKLTNLERYGVEYSVQSQQAKDKTKLTNLERYGHTSVLKSTEVQDKIKATLFDKYGVDHNWKSSEVRDKIKQTNFERHGYEQPLSSSEVRDRIKQTNLERHGYEYASSSPEVQQKIRNTNQEKYGVDYVLSSGVIREKIKQITLDKYGNNHWGQAQISESSLVLLNDKIWLQEQHQDNYRTLADIAMELDVDSSTVGNYCKKHNIEVKYFKQSQAERDLLNIIQFKCPDLNILTNVQNIIAPYELDFYIPSKQIAIEYCGVYWHSDKFRDKQYHNKKYKDCLDKNIRLITIFEDEWIFNRTLVTEKLLSILNISQAQQIYARKCEIKPVNSKDKRGFYDVNHIQGAGRGSINYGLYNSDVLVACMTFIKQQNNVYELNRYATSCSVVGGFSRLLKHFTKNHEFNEIISYADLRWSNGAVYETNGFKLSHTTSPVYEYVINSKRVHRSSFRRDLLPQVLGDRFDPELTEFQNMDNAGIPRIWNCGLKKYSLTPPVYKYDILITQEV